MEEALNDPTLILFPWEVGYLVMGILSFIYILRKLSQEKKRPGPRPGPRPEEKIRRIGRQARSKMDGASETYLRQVRELGKIRRMIDEEDFHE